MIADWMIPKIGTRKWKAEACDATVRVARSANCLLGFILLSIQMPDPGVGAGAAAGLLEPVEHLCGRVDLVVVLALGKNRQLVQVFVEPCRLFGEVTKPFSIIAVCACMRMILSDCGW
jgi:hypothetical protein